MTDFSDRDDHQLVQLALKYEVAGRPIDWDHVVKKMGRNWKNRERLRSRLKTLKQTYGYRIRDFPKRLTARKKKGRPPGRASKRPQPTGLQKLADMAALTLRRSEFDVVSRADAQRTVDQLFAHLKQQDIKQASGKPHENAGEISVAGVSALIDAISPINANDVFVDLGSAIGNVVAQVSLETCVRRCIAVEVREYLHTRGMEITRANRHVYPQLNRIQWKCADITKLDFASDADLQQTTILFANNQVFDPRTNLKIETACAELPHLQWVLLISQFCGSRRHLRNSCGRDFCRLFECVQVIEASVSWCSNLSKYHVFRRRTTT